MRIEILIMDNDVVELTQKLVKTPSIKGNTVDVANIIFDYLEEFGLNPQIDNYKEGEANVYVSLGPSNTDQFIISGHIDTVPIGQIDDWTHEPYSGKIINGELWGRGSVDMKGGTASLACVMIELLKNESDLKQEIFLALTAEEETGLLGAKNYIDKKLIKNASNILIAEPTNLEPKTREKGIVWFDIHSNGRQAHASRPDLGVNAIEELARLIPKLHNVIPDWEDDLLGKTTLNTGTIMGGTAANVIPQYARARFDSRVTPGITNDEVISRYKKVVEEFDGEIGFDFDLIESASSILSKTTNFAELLMENTKKYVSREIEIGGAYYATDGAVFMEYLKNQPEFVIFGPGSTELLHQTDERMEVSQLELSKKIIYESLIMTACN